MTTGLYALFLLFPSLASFSGARGFINETGHDPQSRVFLLQERIGQNDGTSERTFWHGFPTIELATAFAADNEPDEHKICKKCLGQYNTLTRYGRWL